MAVPDRLDHPTWCDPGRCHARHDGAHNGIPEVVERGPRILAKVWLSQQRGCPVRVARSGDSDPALLSAEEALLVADVYARMGALCARLNA